MPASDDRRFVVPTKLDPPPARSEHVPRDELLERLSVDALTALAIVSAPAGYGKSTLLAELARRSGPRVVGWLSLDRDDADPARFWAGVTSALARVRPDAFEELAAHAIRGADPEASLLPRIVQQGSTIDSTVVLILDDYHHLGRSGVHDQLARLVERAPAQLRLVLGSRSDPPLPLARLRAAGELVEVRIADLRFSPAEATVFLNDRLALGLSVQEVEILVQRAEGWVGALYLAALSIARRPERSGFIESFAGTNRFIVDYLAEEVLTQLAPERQEFLLCCSALGPLTGPLVDQVLERTGSGAMLRDLERSNLFVIPLDDDRSWYRLHHLFADLLRAELHEREPALVPRLHRRASSWYAEHGLIDDAIEHALASGDDAVASRLIIESFWPYLHRGQVATVQRWLGDLPDERVISDPRLCVIAAWVSVFPGHPAEVEGWLARA
jgi:LuxR family maltose regulon positive regulatory protein